MALLADDPADRAAQLLLLTQRLTAMAAAADRSLRDGDPLGGAPSDEFLRLSNAYRQEMSRLKADPSLLAGIAPSTKLTLRSQTEILQANLDAYAQALNAVRTITEGLLEAIAGELARDRSSGSYSAKGAYAAAGPTAAHLALDKRA